MKSAFCKGFCLKSYVPRAHFLGLDWSGWIILIKSEIFVKTGTVRPFWQMESVLSCSKTENYLAAWNRLNQWDFIKLYCYLRNFFKYRCSEHSSIGLERTKTEPYSEYVDSNVIGLKRKKPNLTTNTLILTSYLTFYRFI